MASLSEADVCMLNMQNNHGPVKNLFGSLGGRLCWRVPLGLLRELVEEVGLAGGAGGPLLPSAGQWTRHCTSLQQLGEARIFGCFEHHGRSILVKLCVYETHQVLAAGH